MSNHDKCGIEGVEVGVNTNSGVLVRVAKRLREGVRLSRLPLERRLEAIRRMPSLRKAGSRGERLRQEALSLCESLERMQLWNVTEATHRRIWRAEERYMRVVLSER